MASVANRAHCRRNLRGKKEKGSRRGNCLKGWMLVAPRCSGGLVPDISGSRGCDCGPLRKRPSAEKAAPSPRAARRFAQPMVGLQGVGHEREISITQDKE